MLPKNALLRFIIVTILVAVPATVIWATGWAFILTQTADDSQTIRRSQRTDNDGEKEPSLFEENLNRVEYFSVGIGLLVGLWAAHKMLLLAPITISMRISDGAMFSMRVGEAVKKIGYQYESESKLIYYYRATAKEGRLLSKIVVDARACWQGGEFAKISGPSMYVKKLRKLLA